MTEDYSFSSPDDSELHLSLPATDMLVSHGFSGQFYIQEMLSENAIWELNTAKLVNVSTGLPQSLKA